MPGHGRALTLSGKGYGMEGMTRHSYLDNLKVVLIAAIIAAHGVLGYSEAAWWSYADVREVTISPITEATLLVVLGPVGLFVIALLFLVAGLLAPASLERKGAKRYVRDRLLRLGVPFVLFTIVLQPALLYALYHPLGNAPGSYWYEMLGAERQLDTGPLWFVGVLLIFSLVYAATVRYVPVEHGHREITSGRLLQLAAVVAPVSFLVRLAYPYGSESGFSDLNLWEWPACATLFGLGIVAARKGWLTAVPDRLRRRCRTVTLVAVGAFLSLATITAGLGRYDEMWGGWNWPSLAFATVESTLTVFGPVWLLGAAQHHLGHALPLIGPAVSRSTYGAFFLQGIVLIGAAVGLRPVPLPAEAKAFLVAVVGVAGSFALARLLITHVRPVARVL
jgi:hypothetical protein